MKPTTKYILYFLFGLLVFYLLNIIFEDFGGLRDLMTFWAGLSAVFALTDKEDEEKFEE